ncbi:hypothetical protein BRADI_3g08186v3 [Brachypodium distachyon]|uniref:Uncharacterized protein n=1 Tax=Brachypodium distachyon TaxID=15368 RepID=A0A2K2CVY6_BRADI|nr:hypothetical protein BRADI_3g08186v3 [Brachypodium distachyon]
MIEKHSKSVFAVSVFSIKVWSQRSTLYLNHQYLGASLCVIFFAVCPLFSKQQLIMLPFPELNLLFLLTQLAVCHMQMNEGVGKIKCQN